MPWRKAFARHSSGTFFLSGKRVQHAADFVQLFARDRLRRQGTYHQASGGTAEDPFQEVARDLSLRLFFRDADLVNMRSKTFAAKEQALFRHQLHRLQRRGVAVILVEIVVNFSYSRHSQAPENSEDVEFSGGWKCYRRLLAGARGHCQGTYYDTNRMSTRKIVALNH